MDYNTPIGSRWRCDIMRRLFKVKASALTWLRAELAEPNSLVPSVESRNVEFRGSCRADNNKVCLDARRRPLLCHSSFAGSCCKPGSIEARVSTQVGQVKSADWTHHYELRDSEPSSADGASANINNPMGATATSLPKSQAAKPLKGASPLASHLVGPLMIIHRLLRPEKFSHPQAPDLIKWDPPPLSSSSSAFKTKWPLKFTWWPAWNCPPTHRL